MFSSAIKLIVKSVEKECKAPMMKSRVRQPLAKAFMDELTIATTHTVQTRWILGGLEKLIKWT